MKEKINFVASIIAILSTGVTLAWIYFGINSRIAELEGKIAGFETIAYSGNPSSDTREQTCSAFAVRIANEIDRLGYSGVTANSLREVAKEYGCIKP